MKIPNLCKNSVLLTVILYTQLLAICLFSVIEPVWTFELFGYYALYLQWLALGCLFALCTLRKQINRLGPIKIMLASFMVCICVFAVIELSLHTIFNTFFSLSRAENWDIFRRLVAYLLILVLLFRLVGILGTLERRNRAEAQSRLMALQSRIRPHFLFNSLNTVSELVATDPEQAEIAIQSLATLFRANLKDENSQHSLEAELDLCLRYLRLERWRLGDKLSIKTQLHVAKANQWVVPHLILQPVIENAVMHGKDASGAVAIKLDIRETTSHLSLLIENTAADTAAKPREGNGIAIDNIKERLFVLYDDDHSFKVRQNEDSYQVIMRLPKQRLMDS